MKTRHRFWRGRLLELTGKIFVLTEKIRSRQDTRQTKLLSYDTGQRRTGIIVTARDGYDLFANAALENALDFRLGIADRNAGRWFVGAQFFERRACVIMGQEGAESAQQLQLAGISARRTHDHYLAHRLLSISGWRFEGLSPDHPTRLRCGASRTGGVVPLPKGLGAVRPSGRRNRK